MIAAKFFDTLFRDAVDSSRELSIFILPGERSHRFSSCKDAARFVENLPETFDVYHGLGLLKGVSSGRGKATDVAAIGALWADLDFAGEAHKGSKPENLEDAATLFPFPPSFCISSGNGIHAYWVLAEPWIFKNEDERQVAAVLAKAWHGEICRRAKERGWKLENLGDLARVLRPPGTFNNKRGEHKPVTFAIEDSGKRFVLADFEREIKPVEKPPAPSTPRVPFTGSQADLWKRYCAYIAKMPDAIEKQGGGTLTFIAMKVAVGFGFEGDDLRRAFDQWNDTKCHPKWTCEKQIAHKISEGIKYGTFGALRDAWDYGDDVDLSEFFAASRVELFPADSGSLFKIGRPAETGETHDFDSLPPGETETVVIHAPPVREPEIVSPPEFYVPGFINEVMQFTLDTATYPNPAMAFCGALSLLSVLTARRIIGPTGLYTNVYCLALANSGTGKDAPRKTNNRILQQINLDHRIIGRAASGQALEDALLASPELLAQVDELDSVLVSINRPFDALSAELASKYLEFYSAAQHTHKMRLKANEPRRSIAHPHLSIYGTCVPSCFYSNLTPKLMSNGLIARCFVVETGLRGRGRQARFRAIPQSIIDVAEYWRDFNPSGGDIAQFTGASPREVEYDEPAQEIFVDALNRQDDHYEVCQKNGDNSGCSIWGRVVEQAHKLAVLYACSEDHRNPIVGEPAARWATEFMFKQATWLLSQVEERAGEESAFEAIANRVLLRLKNKGGRVLHSEALKASKVDKSQYTKVIETLAARGEVKTEHEGKATYLCQL